MYLSLHRNNRDHFEYYTADAATQACLQYPRHSLILQLMLQGGEIYANHQMDAFGKSRTISQIQLATSQTAVQRQFDPQVLTQEYAKSDHHLWRLILF